MDETDETIYIHLSSTGDGMPTGTWRAGQPEPPRAVAAIGSPAAVAAVRAWADRLAVAEARVVELEAMLNAKEPGGRHAGTAAEA
jgi:hypothetical protein